MLEHGVHRVDEVKARIDQRAIKVEDQQLDLAGIELAVEFDHLFLG